MADRFNKQEDDPVVNTHTYDGRTVDIKCANNGTFYSEFIGPTLLVKDRSLAKLRKLLDAEIQSRQGAIAIPFLLLRGDDTAQLDIARVMVHKIDKQGIGYFRRNRGVTRDSTTNSWYGGEHYLRVLSEEELARLQALLDAKNAAAKAFEALVEEFKFDVTEARQQQVAGNYPKVHPKSEADREWEEFTGREHSAEDDL